MMKHGREGHRKGPREMCTGGEWIYGRNPVVETLRAGRRTATEIILPPYDKGESDEIAQLRATARATFNRYGAETSVTTDPVTVTRRPPGTFMSLR